MRLREPAPVAYRVTVAMLKAGMRALSWRVHFHGLENIPASGPVVLVANHISYVDPLLVGWAVDRRGRMVRYLAKRELFDHWFTGPTMRATRQIMVDRRGAAGLSLQHAQDAMRRGELLVIYPQATIHPVFDPAQGKTGSARLALACNVPLIPVAAWGGQQIATKGHPKRPGWRSVHEVRVGTPIPYAPDDTAADVTRRIMAAIGELLAAAARAHPRELGPAVVDRPPGVVGP